jgi:copper(I)-binding protein
VRDVAGPRGRMLRAVAAACLLAAVPQVAGCAGRAGAAPAIQLATAYVPVSQTPGTTVAYVVIRNNGPPDRLIAARTSLGGQVVFRTADDPGSAAARTVAAVPIAAHSTVAMAPDAIHMVITGIPRLRGGRDITLTLIFARAGRVSVVAQVTNPQSGGSSYFLN